MKTGIILLSLLLSISVSAQKFFTKTGRISFFSSTSVEDIEASTNSVVAILDSKTGEMQFSVLMKGFEFRKALMQEHFNEQYVESDKYPRSEFKGSILNNSEINYTVDGTYNARVKGQLTIHGQTREIETIGTIVVSGGKPAIKSVFNIKIADYKITVPRIHRDNISSTIRITVDCKLEPLK